MGYLFENMEKMNIQEERRNTAEARAELAKAKEEVEKAKAEAEKEREKLGEAKENMTKILIESFKELGADRERATEMLIKKCGMAPGEAREKVDFYWEK